MFEGKSAVDMSLFAGGFTAWPLSFRDFDRPVETLVSDKGLRETRTMGGKDHKSIKTTCDNGLLSRQGSFEDGGCKMPAYIWKGKELDEDAG